MRHFLLVLIAILALQNVDAQIIWTNPISGANPNQHNPYNTGDVSNIIVSGIGRGSGITGVNANNEYRAIGWDSPSFDTADYFSFTMTPGSGDNLTFSMFSFSYTVAAGSPPQHALRSSLDNFTTDIFSGNLFSVPGISLNSPAFQNINTAITFRLYGWGATSSTNFFSVNSFTFYGSGPLPVTFVDFQAYDSENKASLIWELESTSPDGTLDIQRSADGVHFNTLTGVPVTTRSYVDDKPAAGINYYRLGYTSGDGKIVFSQTKIVNISNRQSPVLIYPNPAKEYLYLNIADFTAVAGFQIRNSLGAVVYNEVNLSTNRISIDKLASGLYVIQVSFRDGSTSQQLLKVEN